MWQEYTPLDKLVRGVWGLFGLMLCALVFITFSAGSSAQPNVLVVQQTAEVTRLAVTKVAVTQIVPTDPPLIRSTSTPLPTPRYKEHLLAYFPFARMSIDESGRGFHGQVEGYVYFLYNEAFFWNGEGQIVWNNLPLEQFTVAFDVYFSTFSNRPPEFEVYFLGQQQPCETNPAGFQLLYQQKWGEQIILRNGEKQAVAPLSFEGFDDTHHYLTAVFTDKEAKLYVNGELMGITTGPYVPTSAEVVLGQQIVSSDSCTPLVADENVTFYMNVQDLVFYDTPLSDEEVKGVFEAYLQLPQPIH